MPVGMPSKIFTLYGEDATMQPEINLLAAGSSKQFKVRGGSGSTSYTIDGGYASKVIFDTGGNIHIGYTLLTSNNHTITKYSATMAENDTILQSYGQGFSTTFQVNATSADGSSGAATAIRVGKNSVTDRSINAGGTVNASGADYAEYEYNNGLTIAKGSVVGFKADGTLTLTFSEAVRFGVKSTNPSHVGGDTWGSGLEGDALEAARLLVDRVAYSGKVPVNVTGATPGDYIVASSAQDGSITGVVVSNPDFDQYKKAVGRVNKILEDGRSEIAVMVH